MKNASSTFSYFVIFVSRAFEGFRLYFLKLIFRSFFFLLHQILLSAKWLQQTAAFESYSGLPRYRDSKENWEFESSNFQPEKTQGIYQKQFKLCFIQGIYLQHREIFKVLKNKGCTWLWQDIATCTTFWGL